VGGDPWQHTGPYQADVAAALKQLGGRPSELFFADYSFD